jgi:hypothetical protein
MQTALVTASALCDLFYKRSFIGYLPGTPALLILLELLGLAACTRIVHKIAWNVMISIALFSLKPLPSGHIIHEPQCPQNVCSSR